MECGDGTGEPKHDVGFRRLDGVGCVAGGEGGERILPGAEDDVHRVWAEGLGVVSISSDFVASSVRGEGQGRVCDDLPFEHHWSG